MKQIKITEIEVTPEVAAALCPDGEPSAECISKGSLRCKDCPMDMPKDGDLILLRVRKNWPKAPTSEVMIGS
jgi:hypothetical protein